MAFRLTKLEKFEILSQNSFHEYVGIGQYGGDGEVNTQPSRSTDVSIDAWVMAHAQHNSFALYLDYRVHELAGDRSRVQIYETRGFQLPNEAYDLNIGSYGRMNAHFYSRIKGKKHNWMEVTGTGGLAGSYLKRAWIKIDGPGNDIEKRNIAIKVEVEIPIEYSIPYRWRMRPIGFDTSQRFDGTKFVKSVSPADDPELTKLIEANASKGLKKKRPHLS
jgi:hypothetical protein